MIDYSEILVKNYADKQWSLTGDDYAGLNWTDSSPKPTQSELDALWTATQIQSKKDLCKAQAKLLLASSDWSVLTDVELTNSADFVTYRALLRGLVINPVENPTFPTEPQAIW
jgi:hypothetical protein